MKLVLAAAILIIAVLAWIACGAFAYAIAFADLQRRFPELAEEDYARDRWAGLLVAMFGVAGLAAALVISEGARRGLKWN